MGRLYLFADETGNFDVSGHPRSTQWFGVGTLAMRSEAVSYLRTRLHDVRTRLAWTGLRPEGAVHATADPWPVRNTILAELAVLGGRVDITMYDKAQVIGGDSADTVIYATTWHAHLRHLVPAICGPDDELMLIVAEIGTRRRRALFRNAVEGAVGACAPHLPSAVAFWPGMSDPGLWAADYCLWAVARRWERGDDRAYRLLADNVVTQRTVTNSETESAPPD